MNELYKNIKGYFTAILEDKSGNIIDKTSDRNLIMASSSKVVSSMVSGLDGTYINKIVVGTQGHYNDITVPKTSDQGFVNTRTELFSEESGDYTYTINFNINQFTGVGTVNSETDSGSEVSVSKTETGIQYIFTIPYNAGNNDGTSVFTEAALYAGDNIFSMKCFKAKIKDDSSTLRIIWEIDF